MSISVTFNANNTINISGAGTSDVNGRYAMLYPNYYFNEKGFYIERTRPSQNYELRISKEDGDVQYYFLNVTAAGVVVDSSIQNGASPAPNAVTLDTTNSYSFTFNRDDGMLVAGSGKSEINGTYVSVTDHPITILRNKYFIWENGEYHVLGTPIGSGNWWIGTNLTSGVIYYSNHKTGFYTEAPGAPSPAPYVREYVEPYAPTPTNASTDVTGTTLNIEWDVWALPLTGTSGLSLTGLSPAVTLSGITHSGNTTTATLSRAITSAETPKLSYVKGNIEDSDGNELENFADFAVANNVGSSGGNFLAFF